MKIFTTYFLVFVIFVADVSLEILASCGVFTLLVMWDWGQGKVASTCTDTDTHTHTHTHTHTPTIKRVPKIYDLNDPNTHAAAS